MSDKNRIETRLLLLNPELYSKFDETKKTVELLLNQYAANFPKYTDHSIKHTNEVFNIASSLLNDDELNLLSSQELYVLSMSSILHDIGMCIPEEKISEIESSGRYSIYKDNNNDKSTEDLIRDMHHELSYDFIKKEYVALQIPNEFYAEAIALVSMGHRKVELMDSDLYKPKFFLESGRAFVCLPYLAAILRLADELDITNARTPTLLTKYYLPENEKSRIEWEKHLATLLVNMDSDQILITAKTNDQSVYNALQTQFYKIEIVLDYCQKVIRNIGGTGKKYSLELSKVKCNISSSLSAKSIKFSVDVSNVIETLIGKKIYKNDLTPVREVIQNSLDTCLYKKTLVPDYAPRIEVVYTANSLECIDNGLGMDEYITEKYFAKLSSSFYQQEKIKSSYESIGQFGIGVFSYFMISDFIDVETFKEGSKPLKFRVDRNPENYFYFYDDFEKNKPGTRVVLNIEPEFSEKIKKELLDYIKKTFQFTEIPIVVKIDNLIFEIKKGDFSQTLIEFAKNNNIHSYYYSHYESMKVVSKKIECENAEGSLSFVPDFKYSNLKSISLTGNTDIDSSSTIRVYNKGVYVGLVEPSILSKTYGVINFKKGLNVNIDRNSIQNDRDEFEELVEVELAIANEYLDSIESDDPYKKWISFFNENTKHGGVPFLQDEFEGIEEMKFSFLERNAYVRFLNKSIEEKLHFVSMKDYDIVIASLSTDSVKELCDDYKFLICSSYYLKILNQVFLKWGFKKGIIKVEGKLFVAYVNKDFDYIEYVYNEDSGDITYPYSSILDKYLFDFVGLDYNPVDYLSYHDVLINAKFPLIEYLLNVKKNNNVESEFWKFADISLSKVEDICSTLSGSYFFISKIDVDKQLKSMYEVVLEINKFFKTDFKVDLTDLPENVRVSRMPDRISKGIQ